MAVPKIAIIAIVAILAVPILLGYAMNLNEVTVTDYESNNDSMNVTQLLQTGTDWNIAYGDPYQLNINARANIIVNNIEPALPIFNTVSTVRTAMPLGDQWSGTWGGGVYSNMSQFQVFQIWFDYIPEDGKSVTIQASYNNGNSTTLPFSDLIYLHYSASTEKLTMVGSSRYYDSNHMWTNTMSVPDLYSLTFTMPGGAVEYTATTIYKTGNSKYADVSDGFYFKKFSNKPTTYGWQMALPENTISTLLSINLDSITDSDYVMQLEQIGSSCVELEKTTTNGVVSWKLQKAYNGNPIASTVQELYYNPAFSDNTYQVLLTDTGTQGLSETGHMQLRYIGHWQKTIGEANYYQTYDLDYTQMGMQGNTLDSISIVANDTYTSRTPTIRIDAAKFRAYEYPVITGTLDPAAFKTNPATTISNIDQYGTQLIFGGNTYTVTDGNITMGTHQIPVKNMVFDSVPNADTLQFDNRINGTVVSTTATPSTLQFVGNWGASVSITSMSATSHTETEWVAGSFGWDGLDHNFLIVGLLTSLGAFIALGIYIRRTRSSIWPLLLVCGGAAVVFFIML